MNEKDAWANFTVTGSIADYLKYSAAKHNREKEHEDSDGRAGDPGTEHKGIRQDNNRSDRG